METLSVVISAWNEEGKIARCLQSVAWADEIIVVDNNSTDATSEIAKKFEAKVYHQPNSPMLNRNKNYGFSKVKSDWILSLDADEQIPPQLAKEIRNVLEGHTDIDGFWIPRQNIIFGKWIQYGLWWPDKQLRLFRRGKGQFPCQHVHEYVHVDGPKADLHEPFIHHNYESISQFIRKMDSIYTEDEVKNLLRQNYQINWYDAIRFPLSDFIKIFFAQEGYKDGLHGLVLAMLQSCYSFIVFAKLWEKRSFKQSDLTLHVLEKEFRRGGNELLYWQRTAQICESKAWWQKLFLRWQRRNST